VRGYFYFRTVSGLSLIAILLSTTLHAADAATTLKRETDKCAQLWQRQDIEGIVSSMPDRVVSKSGGRAAVVRELKNQFAEARAYGVQRMEVKPGRITALQSFGKWLTSVVPVTAILHGPHLDLTQTTHVLAVSSDRGKHWSFVVLYQATQAELNSWFPEFAGKIAVPASPDPQVDVVY